MKQTDTLKKYTLRLAKELQPRLRHGVEPDFVIYPADGEGAVVMVELKMAPGTRSQYENITVKRTAPNVNAVLKEIPQRLVAGNLDGVAFKGTNIFLENNKILFIKGDDSNWTEKDAKVDLERALGAHRREPA